MSLVPIGVSFTQAVALNLLNAIFLRARGIVSPTLGLFIPDVTIAEDHRDKLIITDHPVEQSASITDHAFKQPVQVILRVGFSNSSLQSLGNPNYVQQVYKDLLTVQGSRELLTIF